LAKKLPIFVDIDGTLIHGDLFLEAAVRFVKAGFWNIFILVGWLIKGRAYAKARVAEKVPDDASRLPYRTELLDWLKARRLEGHPLYLATAATRVSAQGVADHLGIFEDVLASDDQTNLKSAKKLEAVQALSQGPFGYVGDSRADLAIFKQAELAVVAGGPAGVRRAAASLGAETMGSSVGGFTDLMRAMRPVQWSKNLLVFVPVLVAHLYGDLTALTAAALSFLMFSMAASAAYLVNDTLDVEHDRQHAKKRSRPIANGAISIPAAVLAAFGLLVAAFAVSFLLLPLAHTALLAGYLAATLSYSFWLKRKTVVDVYVLATLYTTRILAGAAALAVMPSFWLLAFSFFLFLSLAYLKRFEELDNESPQPDRTSDRGYAPADREVVRVFGCAAAVASVVVLAFFIQSEAATAAYGFAPLLWLICPLVLYWINRMWIGASRGKIGHDPVVFAVKDTISQIVAILVAAIILMARHLTFHG